MFSNKLKEELKHASFAFIRVFLSGVLIFALMLWDIRIMFVAVTIIFSAEFIYHHKTKGFENRSHFYIYLFMSILFVLVTVLLFIKYSEKEWQSPFLEFLDPPGVVSVQPLDTNDVSIEGEGK